MAKVKQRIQSKERSCSSLQRVSRGQHGLISIWPGLLLGHVSHMRTAKPRMNFSVSLLMEHRWKSWSGANGYFQQTTTFPFSESLMDMIFFPWSKVSVAFLYVEEDVRCLYEMQFLFSPRSFMFDRVKVCYIRRGCLLAVNWNLPGSNNQLFMVSD